MVPWTTGDELAFIKMIGQHAPFGKKPVIELLEGYIQSCHFRTYWGDVSKQSALFAALDRLDRLRV